jgi:hypothetical protein
MQAQLANQIEENNYTLNKNDKRGLKSEVWDSMGVILNESNEIVEDYVACFKCKKVLAHTKGLSKNLLNHIKSCQASKPVSDLKICLYFLFSSSHERKGYT